MSHRKHVRTLESFFAPNQSQSESEKNDTEEEQCINQEETDEDRRKPKKITRSHIVTLRKGGIHLPGISIGNNVICSDIWHKYHECYFEIIYCYT